MKQMSFSEMATYSTVLIRNTYKDGTSGTGTGFIMRLCSNPQTTEHIPVIITNKHVVHNSLVNVFEFCVQDSNGDPIDTNFYRVEYSDAPWVNHPDVNVDLCCLPIAPVLNLIPESVKVFYIPFETNFIPSPSALTELTALEEVIMIGYPIGLSDEHNHKPIIRRGTTATHVKNNYQGKNDFLVDIACFPGSSGSPILILNQGSYVASNSLVIGDRIMLLGILHSGPQYTNKGVLSFASLPNMPTPITNMPVNLGVAVKSSEIFAFENHFKAQTIGTLK